MEDVGPNTDSKQPGITTINIVPGVSIYSILSRLNYKPWFAIAEFVDNAIQSMLSNRERLNQTAVADHTLVVDINISNADGGSIVIRDNAAGIAFADFPRAFRAAQIPPDTSGLSEFGMGMKTASCWFARRWKVRTSALGEDKCHIVSFDIDDIVRDQIEELDVFSAPEETDSHYTEVSLTELHKPVAGRTLGKIKQHLTDIYRVLIRNGDLTLKLNDETLVYDLPVVQSAPYYREPDGDARLWQKDIAFTFDDRFSVSGFAALRETGSNSNAGFSLFRRGRVIQGSGDEGYRPGVIFGAGNSFKSQRLFGELHLEGFDVSHTKDGFQWGEHEEIFLDLLLEHLDADPLPLLKQAQGFRKLEHNRSLERSAEEAIGSTAATLQEHLPSTVERLQGAATQVQVIGQVVPDELSAEKPVAPHRRKVAFEHGAQTWDIGIEILADPSEPSWFSRQLNIGEPGLVKAIIRLNSAHPFLVRFGQRDSESLEVVLRMAVAMVVSEILSRQSGVMMAGVVVRNVNEVLSKALSQP